MAISGMETKLVHNLADAISVLDLGREEDSQKDFQRFSNPTMLPKSMTHVMSHEASNLNKNRYLAAQSNHCD